MDKIRVAGETISPDKMYSGKRVLELLNTSFENGRNNAIKELNGAMNRDTNNAYNAGYRDGYNAASGDLSQLSHLLKKILSM